MPFIDVKLYQGRLNERTEQELITRITDAVVGVFGEEVRKDTWIVLNEVPAPRWGIGGRRGSPPQTT